MAEVAPSLQPVQQGSLNFNQPVSEASVAGIAAPVNALLQILLPVGTVVYSMLEDVGGGSAVNSFQGQLNFPNPATWVLADGRNVTGSAFQALTGNPNVPDLRGIFIRGLNNGGSSAGTRTDSFANPDDPSGSFSVGEESLDKMISHTHVMSYTTSTTGVGSQGGTIAPATNGAPDVISNSSLVAASTGTGTANEIAPKNASMNAFIRIN